jgi:hypothetical protein
MSHKSNVHLDSMKNRHLLLNTKAVLPIQSVDECRFLFMDDMTPMVKYHVPLSLFSPQRQANFLLLQQDVTLRVGFTLIPKSIPIDPWISVLPVTLSEYSPNGTITQPIAAFVYVQSDTDSFIRSVSSKIFN